MIALLPYHPARCFGAGHLGAKLTQAPRKSKQRPVNAVLDLVATRN
jgi:hypothetical protein